MARHHCETFLEQRVPHKTPKSACRCCPFHDDLPWLRIRENPSEWEEAVDVDVALRSDAVTKNRKPKNNSPMFLHRSLQPLTQITFDGSRKPIQNWLGFSRECLG